MVCAFTHPALLLEFDFVPCLGKWLGVVLGLAVVVLRDKVVDSDKRPGGTSHKDHLDKACGLYFLDIPLYLHTHTCGIVVDSLGGISA